MIILWEDACDLTDQIDIQYPFVFVFSLLRDHEFKRSISKKWKASISQRKEAIFRDQIQREDETIDRIIEEQQLQFVSNATAKQ